MADKPNLSGLANNQWDTEFDMDSVLAEEATRSANAAANPGTQDQGLPKFYNAEGAQVPAHINAGQQHSGAATLPSDDTSIVTAPSTKYSNPNYAQPTNQAGQQVAPQVVDPFAVENDILKGAVGGQAGDKPIESIYTQFKDSGTIVGNNAQAQAQAAASSQQQPNRNPNAGTQQPIVDNSQQSSQDPYILALDIQKSLGLLSVPDGFEYDKMDEATLMMLKEHTMIQHRKDALSFVRNKAASADPDTLRIFDYAIQGGRFADIPSMQRTLQTKQVFANFDIGTVENQKAIVELYLSDGLDPNDSRNQFVLETIPAQLEKLESEIQLKEKAQEAQAFFVGRENYEAQQKETQMQQELQADAQRRATERNKQDAWNNQFVDILEKSEWTEGKKDAVKREATLVTLQNGNKIPLWQYKQELMFNNPELFQIFLDFTASFDLESGKFEGQTINASGQKGNETVQNLLNRISQKQRTGATGTRANIEPTNPQAGVNPAVVSVDNDWFTGQ